MTDECRDYLAARGLGPEAITRFGLGQVSDALAGHEYLQGRLVIPYVGPRQNVYNVRFRCLNHDDCKAAGCDSKYMSLPGFPSRVFNVRSIVRARDTLDVTEGEIDAITLEMCDLYAVGIPGVDSMPSHFSRVVAGIPNVRFWADGDKAGRQLASRFIKSIPSARAVMVQAGEDVNSIFTHKGRQGVLDLLEERK